MTAVETVTIINKSGKIISTGKQLTNIFKDAKAAYHDKKEELKTELRNHARHHDQARLETRSMTSDRSRRSRRSRSNQSQSQRQREIDNTSRPPITARNLSYVMERSPTQDSQGSCRSISPEPNLNNPPHSISQSYCPPISRRHTAGPDDTYLMAVTNTLPPPYKSRISRSQSHSDLNPDPKIDMNLAYGHLPYDLRTEHARSLSPKHEFHKTVSRLDNLLLEARCLQYSATAIIAHLQNDPEAMAAVALSLAELSTIVSKMGPSVLRTLQTASPAIFALLVSPQFLIASGVAMGVTVVMFGGFHIVKKIQSNVEYRHEAMKMESSMVLSGIELESIKSWRRGVAKAEALSLCSSIDEEFTTPEPLRQHTKHLRSSHKPNSTRIESICSEQSSRAVSNKGSRARSSSRIPPSEISIRSRRTSVNTGSVTSSEETEKAKKKKKEKNREKKEKKPSVLSTLFEKKK